MLLYLIKTVNRDFTVFDTVFDKPYAFGDKYATNGILFERNDGEK